MFKSPRKEMDAPTGFFNGCLIALVLWIIIIIVVWVWYWLS